MAKQKDNNKNSLYDPRYYKSLSGEAALKERLMGRLPIIGIAGHPFFVDTCIGLLRPKDDFSTMGIEINNIPVDEITRQLAFYYHIPTKTKVDIYSDITELPKDVVTDESLKNIDQLMLVANSFQTQMTDGNRLELIVKSGKQLDGSLTELRNFNNRNFRISLSRADDAQQAENLKKLYGL